MSIDTGAFLRGLTKGMMAAQEMRTQREEREERKSERALQMERWKTDYLDRVAGTLEAITDPADWERHLSRFDERGSVLGFEPGEVRRSIGAFPEERRNKARQRAANEIVTKLESTYAANFWSPEVQGYTHPFEGRQVPIRDLVSIANRLATREVKRPIRGEVQVPRAEEGGLARFLAPRTEERVVGEETVREPALPIPAQPLTFDMLYEKAKGTPWEGRPITLKDGVPDLRLATQIAKDNGWIVTNEDQFRSRERYQRFLREKLVASVRDPSAGINRGELRKQMEQAGMNWAAEMDKAKQEIAIAAASLAQKLRAGRGGAETLADIKLAIVRGQLDPSKFSAAARKILGLEESVKPVPGLTEARANLARAKAKAAAARHALAVVTGSKKKEELAAEMAGANAEVRVWEQFIRDLTQGRTQPPPIPSPVPAAQTAPQAVPEGAPTATNPQTGQRIYWDGKQWVPVP